MTDDPQKDTSHTGIPLCESPARKADRTKTPGRGEIFPYRSITDQGMDARPGTTTNRIYTLDLPSDICSFGRD